MIEKYDFGVGLVLRVSNFPEGAAEFLGKLKNI